MKISAFFTLIFISISSFAASSFETLSKVYQMSSKAVEYGNAAKNKLTDPRLKEFNDRLLADHRVSMDTLKSTAEQMNISLPSGDASSSLGSLGDLKGKAFELKYLENVIDVNSKLQGFLKQDAIPSLNNPVLKKILGNYLPRVNSLLDSAKVLQQKVK